MYVCILLPRRLCMTVFPYTTLFRSVVVEDVGEAGGDHAADPEVHQRPRRVLARRPAAEVVPGHQHARALVLRPEYKRSEEHTSELQSLTNLVCRLLLEKKKTIFFEL